MPQWVTLTFGFSTPSSREPPQAFVLTETSSKKKKKKERLRKAAGFPSGQIKGNLLDNRRKFHLIFFFLILPLVIKDEPMSPDGSLLAALAQPAGTGFLQPQGISASCLRPCSSNQPEPMLSGALVFKIHHWHLVAGPFSGGTGWLLNSPKTNTELKKKNPLPPELWLLPVVHLLC